MSLNHNHDLRAIHKLSHPLLLTTTGVCLVCCILACIDPVPPADDQDLGPADMREDASDTPDVGESSRVVFRSCVGDAPLPSAPLEPWRGLTSPAIARGEPSHALHDVVTTRSRDVDILGHVTYGLFDRELAGEFVDLYIHDCDGEFALLSRGVTRADGAVRFIIRQQDAPFHGEYELVMRVLGDGSMASARLRVLPEGTRFVVYGVDEVLSTDRLSAFQDRFADFFEPVGLGDYTPTARDGAAQHTRIRAAQGYQILYLTPRPHELTGATRAWLAREDFAPGTLWFADEPASSTGAAITIYQSAVLQRLLERGYLFDAAYGASPEDLDAYRRAGIATQVTFVVGETPAPSGVTAIGQTYGAHNATLDAMRVVEQPYESR